MLESITHGSIKDFLYFSVNYPTLITYVFEVSLIVHLFSLYVLLEIVASWPLFLPFYVPLLSHSLWWIGEKATRKWEGENEGGSIVGYGRRENLIEYFFGSYNKILLSDYGQKTECKQHYIFNTISNTHYLIGWNPQISYHLKMGLTKSVGTHINFTK